MDRYPLVLSNMAGWKISTNAGFNRKIAYQWSIFRWHVWLPQGTRSYVSYINCWISFWVGPRKTSPRTKHFWGICHHLVSCKRAGTNINVQNPPFFQFIGESAIIDYRLFSWVNQLSIVFNMISWFTYQSYSTIFWRWFTSQFLCINMYQLIFNRW